MKPDIFQANAYLAICSVWANHRNGSELVVFGQLNEFKQVAVAGYKQIALIELCHVIYSPC